MEKINMYCIYDKATEKYGVPFCSATDKSAYRMLTNTIIQNPAIPQDDLELWFIGSYNSDTGDLSVATNKHKVDIYG